ncbi:ATP-binding protein [Streptacidiphilus sp. PB12-B1b]|uniref:ATP-binding protein n=1 Tax=Streptacidiphilus sp. PB12-B1b TaxID=2705012 RepID=UPI0015FB150D|nr:ATP-binding protein [Streptacidiphilus sp. PB12-B1b]QMU77592.1 ATP-binding protein [Streptacidiphilus sp. PB12-B1b]
MISIDTPPISTDAHRSARTATRQGPAMCVMPTTQESVPALRRFARGLGRHWEIPDVVDEALSVVVSELVTNVLLHSGSPDVALLLTLDGAILTVQVRDTGCWRPRSSPRRVPEDDDACCGRGLLLVEAYATHWAATLAPEGTRVLAQLTLPEIPAPRAVAA